MKIGILTQPLHSNYGGIIQNWALQRVLTGLGHEPEMIFLCHGNRSRGKLFALRCVSFVRCVVKRYLLRKKNIYLHSVFSPYYAPNAPRYPDTKFVGLIHKTPQLTADMDIPKYIATRDYDAFVVGSDQVWREDYSPSILTFFLDFLDTDDTRPRIVYAASFGKSKDYISEKNMPRCRELLHRFNAVSVREYEGLEILGRDFDYHKGVKVLDPTLLLSANDYLQLIRAHICKPHITSYILDSSDDKSTILAEVKRQLNLPVKKLLEEEPEVCNMPTIPQWLAEFNDADFIVTDSFHGCAFAIIFHKPFIAIANKYRGVDRFMSLLRDAGLEERLVFSPEEFEERKKTLFSKIDYTDVERRLAVRRTESMSYLKLAFNQSVDA